MTNILEPQFDILPAAQLRLWPDLAPARQIGFTLYGGTAVALHLGHRESHDFDFFRHDDLDVSQLRDTLPFLIRAEVLQDELNTYSALASTPDGFVKVSFFGRIRIGRINDPWKTADDILLIASPDDLLVTKLRAILGRAEAKDYVDIAELLRAGTSLAKALAAFRIMYSGEPAAVLRSIGYFDDGDVANISASDKALLRAARDGIIDLPDVEVKRGSLIA